ncbi:MAG: hypothetical protein WBZ48_13880 [Bacteroidota bacterium]
MKHLIFCLTLCLSLASISSCKKNDNPVGSNSSTSWNNVLQGTSVSSVCLSGNNIIAGTRGGVIFLSTDNGLSWKGVDTLHSVGSIKGANFVLIPNVTVYNNGINLFAGAGNVLEGSVDVSMNNGLSWTKRDTSFVQVVNCFASIGETVFAGTNNGVYISTNSGISWNASNAGLSFSNYDSIYGHAPQVMRILAQGTALFAGTTGEGIFRSENSGASWIEVDNGLTNLDIYGLASIGPYLFAGAFQDSTGGVFISTNNGITWSAANSGLRMVNIFYADGSNLLAGTNIGVFLSTNNGTTWSILDSMLVTSFAVDRSNLLAGTANGIWHISL